MKLAALSASLLLLICIGSCDSPEAPPDNEVPQELITHVTLQFVDSASSIDTVRASFVDEDGHGPKSPTITGATLNSGKTYLGSFIIEDRSKSPVVDVTEEIEELSTQHQFFFTAGAWIVDRLTTEIIDLDSNGLPVGLRFKVRVSQGGAAVGTYRVVLSHFEKPEEKTGTSMGESDVDITFPISIQ